MLLEAKLKYLRSVLLFLNIGCIFIAAISGWYFSKQALQPIKDVVSSVDTITERNLYQRVNIGNGKDEIAKLAIVLNTKCLTNRAIIYSTKNVCCQRFLMVHNMTYFHERTD